MEKVFGLPATGLATVMGALLLVIFLVLVIAAARRFILVKMGGRNIPRRKGQSILIVIGLMLSSAIIATSLGIGDTVRHSVRSVTLDALGPTDQIIKGPGKQYLGEEYFAYSNFTNIENIARQNTDIRALLPLIEISLPASNDEEDLAENRVRVRGIDGRYSDDFDTLKNISGEIEGYAQISPEILVERNPQYIIASYEDYFSNDRAFKDIIAVKNKAIYTPSEDFLSISGPRFIDGVEELADFIYPGIFR